LCIYYRGGDEDSPTDKPNGEEHESHHAEEANEEVSVQAVYTLDVFNIGPPYREGPGEDVV
jgi:hypothetical protein